MSRRAAKHSGRRAACAALVIVASLGAACSKNPAPSVTSAAGEVAATAAEPFVEGLVASVPGVSKQQAALVAGSLLGLAKSKLAPGQFSQVAAAVPGADALVTQAQKQGLPSAPSGLAAVTEFLGKSGISSDQVSQIATALGSAVAGKTSPDVATAFQDALK
jgi:Protein of unknown function VcgC/VcgE (DUF2780)